jgi:hypothetical protein
MVYELRRIILSFVISLALIRFWIEIVTTTILENSNFVRGVNNNKFGFHHWQLGLLIIFASIFSGRFINNFKTKTNIILGVGLALFLDQYTYVLRLAGLNLPFEYRSQTDYLIIGVLVVGLIFYWKFLEKKTKLKSWFLQLLT